ncbi:MAG TPA: CotH kinase family protein [Verrucomicrobiae bacterium]|nr:CotH kinase family protein [Verrucomicrobiae bacterium]
MLYLHCCARFRPVNVHFSRLLAIVFLFAVLSEAQLWSQNLIISEFMAANNSGVRDADGDFSDWIEIYNPERGPASLAGWYVSDNPLDLTKWRFPDVTIPGQGFVLVFASGKDRTDPQGELHTNFNLDRDGEYLALTRPDATTKATEFAPTYPRQLGDVSYGVSMSTQTVQFVPPNGAARAFFPANDQLGLSWVQPAFNDSTWTPVSLGVGYDRPQPGQTNTTIEPEDVTQPGDLVLPTSSNSPGNETSENAIDNTSATKYLNFDKLNAGFTVTPSAGDTVVQGLRFTSANDAPERDPTSFVLSGSRDGTTFTEIARGSIPDFTARFFSVEVAFTNRAAYLQYRLLFPTVRNAATAVAVQISEVQFLGYVGAPPPDFLDLISTSLEAQMFGQRTTAYLRVPFTVQANQPLDWLALWVQYDDGFVAFLNGVEVARANAPQTLAWNSAAAAERRRTNVLREQRFDLSGFGNLIVPGANLLAVQALNDRADSPDFLMRLRLENTQVTLAETGYMTTPSAGTRNSAADLGLVADPVMERTRGFYSAPMQVAITGATEGAVIRCTTNGAAPSLTNGFAYAGPIPIQRTTTLRAAAFRSGWRSSQVITHTYLYLSDIVNQNQSNTVAAGFPAIWDTQPADYGLDSRVVGPNDNFGGKYRNSLSNDLLSLPTMSIVMDVHDMFGSAGIYSYPNNRGDAWERAGSLELIYPSGQAGFQANAGFRIQGGAFRRFDLTLKKSFRVIFREEYGSGRLHYPLFGPNAAEEFNNFVLRANSNDAWPYYGGSATYLRDAFAVESARALGMVASHGSFVHLYINGRYWGLYNPIERPDAVFSASYHGGDEDNWDAINQDSAPDGNYDAWNRLMATMTPDWADNAVYQRVQGNNPDGTRNPAYEVLLDVPNMIDYMILNFYIGNGDWPGRNYWVGRDRTGSEGFQFYPWDSEASLFGGTDNTGVNSAVARPYAAARANVEFRMQFADRVYRHFFNGGAFSVNPAAPAWNPSAPTNNLPAARFAALAEQVRRGIVGESARWGDQLRAAPYTRDEHWQTAVNDLLANYFPARSAAVLEIFRNAGLYPRVDPPLFNHPGGLVNPGFSLVMSAPQGTIYYTTNGTDPRTPVEIEELNRSTPVTSNTLRKVLVPSAANGGSNLGTLWRTNGFNDTTWTSGQGGIGYDTAPDYLPFIGIDVDATMRNLNGSAFIRIPFQVASTNQLNYMVLRMRFDDGFTAFLNGQPIADANAPTSLSWNSFATAGNSDAAAVQFRDFDVSAFVGALRPGENILAIQGLNVSLASSDFLIDAQLVVAQRRIVGGLPTALVYTGPIPLSARTLFKARVLNGTEWSALQEVSFILPAPELVISELHYHPSKPSAAEILAGFTDENAFEFVELFNPGTGTFALQGVHFVQGIQFDFSTSAITQLAPGAYVLVVRNRAAFEHRYGVGLPIAGEYTGHLSNAGDHVAIADAAGNIIFEITYGTATPWPAEADGGGPSLELQNLSGDRTAPDHWRASTVSGGSPGLPVSIEGTAVSSVSLQGNQLRLSIPAEAGRSYHVFAAESLEGNVVWRHESMVGPIASDGTIDIIVGMPAGSPARFYRAVATLP